MKSLYRKIQISNLYSLIPCFVFILDLFTIASNKVCDSFSKLCIQMKQSRKRLKAMTETAPKSGKLWLKSYHKDYNRSSFQKSLISSVPLSKKHVELFSLLSWQRVKSNWTCCGATLFVEFTQQKWRLTDRICSVPGPKMWCTFQTIH